MQYDVCPFAFMLFPAVLCLSALSDTSSPASAQPVPLPHGTLAHPYAAVVNHRLPSDGLNEKSGSESHFYYDTIVRTSFSGIAYRGQHDCSASQSPARTSQSNTARQMKPALGRAVTASIYLPQKNR
jgi:hypothetical protein